MVSGPGLGFVTTLHGVHSGGRQPLQESYCYSIGPLVWNVIEAGRVRSLAKSYTPAEVWDPGARPHQQSLLPAQIRHPGW